MTNEKMNNRAAIVCRLETFAEEHDLLFTFAYKPDVRTWVFKFQNRERTWVYFRELTEDQILSPDWSREKFVQDTVDRMREKVRIRAEYSANN